MVDKAKAVDNGPLITVCKYVGMTGLVLSWVLTALGYFPINLISEMIGALAWLYIGFKWKDFNICYLHLYLVVVVMFAAHTQGLF